MKKLSKAEIKKELAEILTYGNNDIIIHEEDINLLTDNKELLAMGVVECSGSNSAIEAIKSIVLDFEKNKLSLTEAYSILVYFQARSNYNMMNYTKAMEIINDRFLDIPLFEEPYVLFGTSCNDSLKKYYLRVTIFVGYSKKRQACK